MEFAEVMQDFREAGEWISEQLRSKSGRELTQLMTNKIVSTQWTTRVLNWTTSKPQVCRKTLVAD
ncbi:hypothetical protein BLL38_27370 [Pseudomonas gessardii]|nr:hypothetical protein BLL38_27370 [Pseudomonas gessardii]